LATEPLTFIAFDFGMRKMGVAVGQNITMTATTLDALQMVKGVPNWNAISKLIEQWRPAGFVVGIPLNMDATSQPITSKARQFAAKLQEKFGLPVYEVDERLTTVAARQQLFELGGYRALQEISIDSFAAKIILEAWMRTILH
jgi:putative holliday junction resolvase